MKMRLDGGTTRVYLIGIKKLVKSDQVFSKCIKFSSDQKSLASFLSTTKIIGGAIGRAFLYKL